MTERLQTVIDAAERAAEAIRYDAEEQARRHLAEAQRKADRMTAERVRLISELTDDLIRHAGSVRDHSEQMVRALEDAISSVTGKLGEPGFTDPFDQAPPSPYEAPPLPLGSSRESSPYASPTETRSAWTPAAPPAPPNGAPTSSEAPPAPRGPAAQPATAPPPSSPAPASSAVPQDALLHATRLAVAGNDREVIRRALRDQFGVSDPDPIVNRVLGEA